MKEVDAGANSTTQVLLAGGSFTPAQVTTHLQAFVTFVNAAYSNQPDVLADFGLHPEGPGDAHGRGRNGGSRKRKATRAARHTMGKTQKKGVKGAMIGIVVTALTAPTPIATTPSSPIAPPCKVGLPIPLSDSPRNSLGIPGAGSD